jgi:2-polyprenyl-3-methyl-5-hydroxy-6-metoxy-1,4-benzoquinol methylase
LFGAPGSWDLHACSACGSAYLDPRPTKAAIGLAYERYFGAERPVDAPNRHPGLNRLRAQIINGHLNATFGYELEPASRLGRLVPLFPKRRWRAEWSVRHLRLPAGRPRLLDVGCGTGEFLIRMREAGWEVRGIEPDPASADIARRAGLDVEQVGLQETQLADRSFDAITLNHVIEHLHNPGQAVARCRELLRPEGTLWIATPNVEANGHRRFGEDWFGLDPPRHLILFNPGSLGALLRGEGLASVRQIRAYRAELTYPASEALQRGGDPIAGDAAIAPRVRQLARLADLQVFLRPDRAEELTVIARAPAAPGAWR